MRESKTLEVVSELEALLRKHKDPYWLDLIHDWRRRLELAESAAAPPILGEIRGHMRGLTDLWISRDNGHEVEDERAANEELSKLTDELWDAVRGSSSSAGEVSGLSGARKT